MGSQVKGVLPRHFIIAIYFSIMIIGSFFVVSTTAYADESLPLPVGGSVGGSFANGTSNQYYFWLGENSNISITYNHDVYAVTDYWCAVRLDGPKGAVNFSGSSNTAGKTSDSTLIINSSMGTSAVYYSELPSGGPYYFKCFSAGSLFYDARYGVNKKAPYTISLANTIPLSQAKFYSIPTVKFSGGATTIDPVVTMYDKVLTNGVDYYVSDYANNDRPGTASAKIIGIGKFSGSQAFTYTIIPQTQIPQTQTKTFPGLDRHDTAAQIALEAYPTGAKGVLIATGSNFPDALAASALAGKLNYPILTVQKGSIPASTKAALAKLNPSEIIILGGVGTVSTTVETALKSYATKVMRIQGATRIKTAVAIYNYGSQQSATAAWSKTAIIANAGNYPDALAISPYAAYSKSPIFLVQGNTLDSDVKTALTKGGFTKVIIVGDTGAVSASIENQIKTIIGSSGVIRQGGANRYATAKLIASYCVNALGMHYDGFGVATGENFPDALAGGPLLGKQGSVLLLAHDTNLSTLDLLKNQSSISKLYVLGGTGSVSQTVVNQAKGNLGW